MSEDTSPQNSKGVEEESRLPRNIWYLTLTSFLTDISSEMLVNLLPIFLYSVLGVRTAFIGVIEGVAEAVASLLKLVSGWLSDRSAKRKPLVVAGYALSTIAKPFLYLATSWLAVLAVRFSDRLGKGLRTAPRDALVADSVGRGQRGRAFGLHRAGDTAGAVLGLLVAWVVVRSSQQGLDLDRVTFQRVVLLSIIPSVLAVLVLLIGVREAPAKDPVSTAEKPVMGKTEHEPSSRGGRRGLRNFIIVLVLFTLGNSSDAFLVLRAQTLGLSVAGVLGLMMSFNLIYALLATPAGILSDRIGRRKVLLAGWSLYGLVYLGFAQASRPWHAWVLMGGYGMYYGLTEGAARAYIADLVPAAVRGSAYGAMHMAVGISLLPASLLAGLLWQGVGAWQGWGPGAPFIFGAVMALVAAAGLALFVPEPGRVTG